MVIASGDRPPASISNIEQVLDFCFSREASFCVRGGLSTTKTGTPFPYLPVPGRSGFPMLPRVCVSQHCARSH